MNKPQAFSSPDSVKRVARVRRFYLATILLLGSSCWLLAAAQSSGASSNSTVSDLWQRLTSPGLSVSNIVQPSAQPNPVESLAATVTSLTPLPISADTGEKPQSKIWYYGNTWWAVLPSTSPSSGTWLWKLGAGNAWSSVLQLSTSTSAKADTKVLGGITHILLHNSSAGSAELVSVEYVSATNTYQLWSARATATSVALPNSETATIDIDSAGRMWLATENGANLNVHYSDSPYLSFSGPVSLAGNINEDDIGVVTALPNNTIGVLWSNQNTKRYGFKLHVDGGDPNTWSVDESPASQSAIDNVGAGMADDHMNLAVAADGTVYAAVKTSYDTAGYPKITLLVRRPNGAWDNLYDVDQNGTRAIVLLNENTGKLRVVYSSVEGGGSILYKETSVSAINFGGAAQTLISGGSGNPLNNVTSTKRNWGGQVVLLASNGSTAQGVLVSEEASLRARWRMEEVAGSKLIDDSESGNDARLTGTTRATSLTAHGQALSFNNVATGNAVDYAVAPNNPSLNITNAITLAAWIRPQQIATQDLINKGEGGAGTDGYTLSLATGGSLPSSGKVFARFNNLASGDTYRVNSTTAYPTDGNTWMHVAATYDGTTIRMYINGVLESSVAGPASITSNTLDLAIGARGARGATAASRGFKGQMDDVQIYSRALTASEIQAAANKAPVVDAGPDQAITLPNSVSLAGSATDEPGSSFTKLWSQVSGPGTVTFTDATAPATTANFSAAGSYVLRLTANDGALTSSDDVTIVVYQGSAGLGQVGYWKFEESGGATVVDSSPVGNNGTLVNQASRIAGMTGQGQALSLDGVDDHASVPNSSGLNITGTGGITLAAWVKPGRQTTQEIIRKGDSYSLALSNSGANGKVFFRLNNNAAFRVDSSSQYPFDGNTWAHIAATYDGAVMRVYLNGVATAFTPTTPPSISNSSTSPLYIGAYPPDTTTPRYFQGQIDEAQVYNRALTDSEIQALAALPNQAPVVNAGIDQTVDLPATASLSGSVTDEAGSTLTTLWSQVSGPGTVAFGNAAATTTTASFSTAGVYVLQLDASDGSLAGSDQVTITVNPANGAPTASDGSLTAYVNSGAAGALVATDGESNPLTYTIVSNGALGTATITNAATGAYIYTPNLGATGVDTFTFKASDGSADSNTATVTVTINGECSSDALRSYWRMEEGSGSTLVDASPCGNNANLFGGFNRVAGQAGQGQALSLNGTTAYGRVTNSTSPGLNPTRALTLAAWVKPEKQATQDLIKKGDVTGTGSTGFTLTLATPTGTDPARTKKVFFRLNNNDASYRLNSTSDYPFDSNTWMHVAVTYDGAAAGTPMKIYINGVQENTIVGPASIGVNALDLMIGGTLNADGTIDTARLFKGQMDEVRMYARALSGTEILALNNRAPSVDAGPDQATTMPADAALNGTATDDGLPNPTLNVAWSKISGPGNVSFEDSAAANTTANFSAAGTYVLRLTAYDGAYSSSDDMTVNVSPGVTSNGLNGYWKMEESSGTSIIDSSPLANNGSLVNQATRVTGRPSLGQALSLDGVDDHASVPNSSSLNITSALTFSAWINPGKQGTQELVRKGDSFALTLATSSGGLSPKKVFFRLNNSDTYRVASTSDYPFDGNTWVHVAATYDGTTMRIYFNGVKQGEIAGPASINSGSAPLTIGGFPTDTTRFLQGQIDEVQVYNRALTDSEIQAMGQVNQAPNAPTLNAPADNSVGVSTSPTLNVSVTDPDNDNLTVTYYGRRKAAATPGEDFTIVALPDTQFYSSSMNGGTPEMFNAQTQWIVANKTARNIAFVTQLGDCVQNGDLYEQEWINAQTAISKLENPQTTLLQYGIPYGIAVGNHDQSPKGDPNGSTNFFNQYFGSSRFAGRPYYGGHYGSNNDNHYELFSASGMDFVAVHLEYDPAGNQAVLDWANSVVQTHSNRRAIIVSHYLVEAGNQAAFSAQGQKVYNALKANSNLFLMLAGHISEGKRQDTYNGNTVNTLMSDYQGRTNGGNGLLRTLTFSPVNNQIKVETYSPVTNSFERDADSEFTLSYNMQNSSGSSEPFAVIATNSNVPSGTNSTTTWSNLSPNTEYEWYATVNDGRSTTTGPTWHFTPGTTNQPPVAVDDAATITEDSGSNALSVLSNDTDADGNTMTISSVTQGTKGTASITADSLGVNYTPGANANGTDTFTYTVSDGNGGSDTGLVTVTITPVNDAPSFTKGANQTVPEDASAQSVAGWATNISAGPSNESSQIVTFIATNNNNSLFTVQPAISSTGTLTYTPASNTSGTATVTATLKDNGGTAGGGLDTSVAETFTITVTGANDPPVANNDNKNAVEDTALVFAAADLVSNDTDPDGDPLTVSAVALITNSTHGTVSLASGQITYSPAANYNGAASFSYTVVDGNGGTATASVNVTISAVNDVPAAANDAYNTNEDTQLNITAPGVLGNDSDADGTALTAAIVTSPTRGTLTLNPNGSFTYNPGANLSGADSFTYRVSDGVTNSNTATVSIAVGPVNDAPVVTNPGGQTNSEGDYVALQIQAGDVDSAVVTYGAAGLPPGLAIDPNTGVISGTIEPGAANASPYTVSLNVTDGVGGANEASFSWSVVRAITFRSSSFAQNNGTASIIINRPSRVLRGNVMLAAIDVRGSATITPPTGWTPAANGAVQNGTVLRQAVYYKVATPADESASSYTWTLSGAQASAGGIVAYGGVDDVNPVDVIGGQSNPSSTSITAPSITTVSADTMLVGIFGTAINATVAPPSSPAPAMVERGEAGVTTGKDKLTTEIADVARPAVGPTGLRTATADRAGANIGQIVALKPRPAPSPEPTEPPAAPATLSAAPGSGQVSLTWSASSGATSYNVKRSETDGGPYSSISNPGSVTGTSYTDSSVTDGTTYYYVVSAVNGLGEGANSVQAAATPCSAPTAPAGLIAAAGNAEVSLTWNQTIGAVSYNIKRSTTSGGPFVSIGDIGGTSYTDTTAANGTRYYYVVSAVSSCGAEGPNSAESSALPQGPVGPNAPSNLSGTAVSTNLINLSWVDNSTNEDRFGIERCAGGGCTNFQEIGSVGTNATSYSDNSVVGNTTYRYRVRAVNGVGTAVSNTITQKTPRR